MAEYIERDMFLKIISHKPSFPTTEREDRLINGFISAVKNCPAADVVPVRHGRWTGHDIGNGRLSIDDDTCSLCGSRFYQIAETGCVWHYCPNCGAMMEES